MEKQNNIKKPNKKHFLIDWFMITVYKIIVFVSIIVFISFSLLKFITRHNEELTVPNFTELGIEEATKIANNLNIRLKITDSIYINNMKRGEICKQNPIAGSKVKKNRRILLTINSVMPRLVSMPSLVGYSLRQAKAELFAQQLSISKLIYQFDMATNNVLQQKYNGRIIEPGTKIETESEIELVLGLNRTDRQTYVPKLKGQQFISAKSAIHDSSLNLGKAIFDETVRTPVDSISAYVYKQSPSPNDTVPRRIGSKVTIYLTKDRNKLTTKN